MELKKRWDILADLIKEFDLKSGIEIGAKAGQNIAHVLSLCPDFTFVGVDCWDPSFKYQQWAKKQQCVNELAFDKVAKTFPGRTKKIKLWSDAASALFPDASLDLVFIDASHDFDSVYYDIEAWFPKVRDGGFIAGHDYDHPKIGNVKGAVNYYFDGKTIALFDDYVWAVRK